MQKFVDAAGRIWVVEINVATIKRVRSLAGVNLLEVVDGELIERLSSDPILLCDVLYAVCQPQAQRDSVTDEAFGIGLAGDVIAEATTALVEGLVAFFPEPRRRLLEKAAAKYREVQTKAMSMVEAKLDSPQFQARLLNQLDGGAVAD
jgi:hypothetical protein